MQITVLQWNVWYKRTHLGGFHEENLNWRLDYVFATPDLAVQDARILATTTSDHLPILATLELT